MMSFRMNPRCAWALASERLCSSIGLVFGISRTLIHFDGPWDLDDVVSGLSGMDDVVDDDDFMNAWRLKVFRSASAAFECDL